MTRPGGSVQEVFLNPAGRVGSGQEVLKISRVVSGGVRFSRDVDRLAKSPAVSKVLIEIALVMFLVCMNGPPKKVKELPGMVLAVLETVNRRPCWEAPPFFLSLDMKIFITGISIIAMFFTGKSIVGLLVSKRKCFW